MPDRRPHTGGCLCGQVRYEAVAEPVNVRLCHCTNCHRTSGSAFTGRALFPPGTVTVTGETLTYAASPDMTRHVCAVCHTPVHMTRADGIAVTVGSLDDPDRTPPDCQLWVKERIAWARLPEVACEFETWAG